jgi:hypothetical protein
VQRPQEALLGTSSRAPRVPLRRSAPTGVCQAVLFGVLKAGRILAKVMGTAHGVAVLASLGTALATTGSWTWLAVLSHFFTESPEARVCALGGKEPRNRLA